MSEEITWVWVTKSGSKYYGSPLAGMLRGNGIEVPIKSAQKLGYDKASRGYL